MGSSGSTGENEACYDVFERCACATLIGATMWLPASSTSTHEQAGCVLPDVFLFFHPKCASSVPSETVDNV